MRNYEKGAITADHLVVESLHQLDPAAPALVLAALPRRWLRRRPERLAERSPKNRSPKGA